MNKRLIITWVAVFVAWMIGNFVINGLLLLNDYARLSNLYRPMEGPSKLFPLLILAHVIMSFGFAMIYSEISSTKPWLQRGLRYGVAVALMTAVPTYIIYYVVQPLPGILVVKQVVFSAILVVLLGVLAAFLYRQAPAHATASAPTSDHGG
jgi:hypothetical protein